MIWIRLFAFSAIYVVFRSCEGYNVKSIMNDAKNREAMIGKVLEAYVKPFKRLSANFPRHDVEIQLEFQRPQTNQQATKLIQKWPIYRETRKRPKVHALHERGHSGVDYLAERNANEHYSVPSRNTMDYLPIGNVADRNTMVNFLSRGVIDHYGAGNVIDSFGRHNGMDNFGNQNGMVNFGGRNGISNLAGHNTAMDNFSSRNTLSNNAGYSEINNVAGHNAVDSFAGHDAMNVNYRGVYPMNHGASNVMGKETVHVGPMAPSIGKGVPPVARQAETESTTTEAAVTANTAAVTANTAAVTANNAAVTVNKGPSLSLNDIRQLLDEYAEKIISSKAGNEQQRYDNDQVPQVYIQDNNGQLDDSMLSNLDQIANLIKKGVQVHKIDENDQESFLPKLGLNWMRIKVPVS